MNVNKLRGKIVEKEMSIETVAERMGVHASTVYRKLNDGGKSLTIGEVKKVCDILGLTNQEAIDIFLPSVSHVVRQ